MATGSQAAARARLQAACYRTKVAQYLDRCDKCLHATGGTKQHGLHCCMHGCAVKTHGWCTDFRRKA